MDRQRGTSPDRRREQRDRLRLDSELEGVVAPVTFPDTYSRMLGPERSERLGELIVEARLEIAHGAVDAGQLAEHASLLAGAERALDQPLSKDISVLEARLHTHQEWLRGASERELDLYEKVEAVPWWHRAERSELRARAEEQRDYADRHQEAVAAIGFELGALSGRNGHPDIWLEHHGRVFAQGLVARAQLERERTHGELAPTRTQPPPELDRGRSHGEEQSLEMEGPR